jgi:hypothetical protein
MTKLSDKALRPDGARWCEPCGHWHGPLYDCDSYPAELRAAVRVQSDRLIANLQNPAWVAEQRANGVSQTEIEILRWFAGVPGNSLGTGPDSDPAKSPK